MTVKKIVTITMCIGLMANVLAQTATYNDEQIEKLVDSKLKSMTLEEKASMCSGRDDWSTREISRLQIPWVWMSDGPHGLRRAPATNKAGYGDQAPATCFPTASALAATWNPDLIYQTGQHLGMECQALNVNVLLGPGVNIKRHPLGGRNFEYYSEDPVLAGTMGTAFIQGVQSEGVGTSLKHFALNNEEYMRMLTSSQADERTMREIYLFPFEMAVKQAFPWTVMACYNRINGVYGTQNPYTLTNILRNEWGYKGVVISDWVSVVDRVEGLRAGMNIEMPSSAGYNDSLIVQAVKSGKMDEKILDENVRLILRFVYKAKSLQKQNVTMNVADDHLFAQKVAAEAITLLKNDKQVLPVTSKYKTIAIIGEFAKHPRFQGNGSSEVKPTQLDITYNEILKRAGKDYKIIYAQGYSLDNDNDLSKIEEAKQVARQADVVIVFAGLPLSYESEGIDRKHINLPASHDKLISEIASVQPNVAVVLTNGSAVALPWNNQVASILETWLPGQAGAGAIADVLFGKVNPSGKLAETFPVRLEDSPAFLNFPGENREVLYGERIYVGYRYYDIKNIAPLYPFGHGLSYTTFEYSDISVSKDVFSDTDSLTVSFKVKNTGSVAGKEVTQLYISDLVSSLPRPNKELKKFAKIELQPGESKLVTVKLGCRDFSYFNPRPHVWVAESGDFEILIGSSSRDIRLKKTVTLQSKQHVSNMFDEYCFLNELLRNPVSRELTKQYFKDWLMEFAKPGQTIDDVDQFNLNGFLMDMPLVKYPYITQGKVSKQKIDEFVKKLQELDE
jgi:beta-glucosidase